MLGAFTLKTISGFFASILGFISLSSASLSPTPTPTGSVTNQKEAALQEFHDLQSRMETLEIQLQFPRILKRGLQGNDVKQLQQDLSKLVPSFTAANISGYFGIATEKALKQFQLDHHLSVTGVFDSQTRDNLAQLITTDTPDSDDKISDLENFLSATPSVTPTITPVATNASDSGDSISPDELDQACLDAGYISPDDAITFDQIDEACANLGYVLPDEDNSNSCDTNVSTPTPSSTPALSTTPTPSKTPAPTPTPSKTPTPTPTPSKTPTPTPTPSKTPTPTPTPSKTPTPTPTPSKTPTPTPTPSNTPTPTPTKTP